MPIRKEQIENPQSGKEKIKKRKSLFLIITLGSFKYAASHYGENEKR
jgi:hypothetical protein